jgi:hypothetical protein
MLIGTILSLILMGIGLNGGKMGDKLVSEAKQNIVNDVMLDKLFNAVSYAEMGPQYLEALGQPHSYIRTSAAPPTGSSAYGPLQLTSGPESMVQSILADKYHGVRRKIGLTSEELEYMNRFVEQGEKFLEYGKEPGKPGYDVKYDYSSKIPGSGVGDLSSPDDRALYDAIGRKIIDYEYNIQAQGDPMLFLQNWKQGRGSSPEKNEQWVRFINSKAGQDYIQRFKANLTQ